MGRYGTPVGGALPGKSGGSLLTFNKAFPYNGVEGGNFWTNFQSIFDAYGSPPDHQTFGAIGLDRAGRPLYISLGGPVANGPYDIDLTLYAPHAVDQTSANNPNNLFGLAEFERILRWPDRDAATLPQRLASLTNSGSGSLLQARCAEFTTESWNVPTAASVLPLSLRNYLPNYESQHPVDVLYAQFAKNKVPINNPAKVGPILAQLLPWEVMQGLKMDLNRPFGSGAYSTAANGTLTLGGTKSLSDQPGTTGEQVQQMASDANPVVVSHSYAADGSNPRTSISRVNNAPVNDSLAARQLFARHLYVLMMAVADTDAILAELKIGNPTATADDVTRMIAQWAVNVVAYRDHNSVMIPFPYDPNPFSGQGWNPPSDTPANMIKYTVWGCKRPELLISENLALHDRRTQDLSDEVVDKNKPGLNGAPPNPGRTEPGRTTDTGKKKDPGFNSKFRPQGSLFVELYNPWTIVEPRTTDLGPAPASKLNGVELTKKTPPLGNAQPSPVWRLVIVDPTKNQPPANFDELPDPDSPLLASRPTIERSVYFVNLAKTTYPTGDGQVSYSPSANNAKSVVIPPSGYAVVGSGDTNQQNRTFIGFENGKNAGSTSTTRMVTLNPADLTDARVVRNTKVSSTDPPAGTPIPQVLGIDSPHA